MQTDILTQLIASLQAVALLLSAQLATMPSTTTQTSQIAATINTTKQIGQEAQDSIGGNAPLTFTAINNLYSDAVVNILCKGTKKLKGGTATGVIISPEGLMLANAHIAQYILLEQLTNAPISCTVRTGSPAKTTYTAKVLYIPQTWATKNAEQIISKIQRGTGQDDYALIQLIPLQNQQIQDLQYIQVNPSFSSVIEGNKALIRAYPAEFISAYNTLHNLRAISTVTTLGTIATFNTATKTNMATPDLVSLGGTIVAQGGSSGGAVIDKHGKLIAIIVTSTKKAETKDRNLKAITLSHINNSLKQNTGKSLDELLAMPIVEIASEFKNELLKTAELFANAYNK